MAAQSGNAVSFTEKAAEYGLDDHAFSTHSAFFDYDNDGDLDLFLLNHSTVEYSRGSLEVFQLRNKKNPGFTNKLYRNDGDLDLVVGNLGTNSQLSAKPDQPLELFYGDFDENGSIDPLLCYYVQGKSWPLASRDDLLNQLPYLKKKFLFFKEYANAQIQDILTPEQLQKSEKLQATTLETAYFENTGSRFVKRPLPTLAQVASVHAIQSLDVNGDGFLDLLLAGNTFQARVKLGRLDGNHGLVLLGDGKGDFKPAPAAETGLKIRGAVRQIERVRVGGKPHVLFGVNDGEVKVFQVGG